jgi:cytochrome c553
MKLSHLIALGFGTLPYMSGSAIATDVTAEKANPALQNTVQACASCHGANGRSVAPTFPNLAAQTAPYIEAQLKAFKDQSRGDPDAQAYMWGMAAPLSDAMIGDLAAFYAKQTPAQGKGQDPALIARGKQVFEQGVPAAQIPPCASCHGTHAQGMAAFPRLAGQHAPYLLKQLIVIQSALRNAPVMHGVVKELTRDQMLAVAAYLESI